MVPMGGLAVVLALLAARTTAVATVAPVCRSRLPMTEIHGWKCGWLEVRVVGDKIGGEEEVL
jgi:hypothetical protein